MTSDACLQILIGGFGELDPFNAGKALVEAKSGLAKSIQVKKEI